MTENPSLVLSYVEGVPPSLEEQFRVDCEELGVDFFVERRGTAMYASLEWLMPSLIMVYITKEYFGTLLTEAAKDHYPGIKRVLFNLIKRTFGERSELRAKTRFSMGFSVYATDRRNRRVKFMFPEGVELQFYSRAVEDMFNCMERIDKESGDGSELFLEYNGSRWEVVDMDEEIRRRAQAKRERR